MKTKMKDSKKYRPYTNKVSNSFRLSKRIVCYAATFIILAGISSCKKDFMNLQPLDKFSDEAVWNDPALIQTFINNIYLGIPHGFSNIMMSSIVDETMYNADFGTSNATMVFLMNCTGRGTGSGE
jgi:hypothetical protein